MIGGTCLLAVASKGAARLECFLPVLRPARNPFMRFLLAALCAWVMTAPIPAGDLLPPGTPIEQAIDHYIEAKLNEEGASSAAQADDATLIRRLTLDLVGRIPTVAESSEFI